MAEDPGSPTGHVHHFFFAVQLQQDPSPPSIASPETRQSTPQICPASSSVLALLKQVVVDGEIVVLVTPREANEYGGGGRPNGDEVVDQSLQVV